MVLIVLVRSFSVYLSASCLPIKLFLYFPNLCNESGSVRGEAAPNQGSQWHGEIFLLPFVLLLLCKM